MKKQPTDKPIDEELLMRMMAGEAGKPQGNRDAAITAKAEETETGEQEPEKEVTAVRVKTCPAEKAAEGKTADGKRRKGKQAADYDSTFLKGMDIPARYGKPVYVRREYHERIAKISMMLTGGQVSLSAYIDNVLAQHFEQYREEIEAAYAGKMDKLF